MLTRLRSQKSSLDEGPAGSGYHDLYAPVNNKKTSKQLPEEKNHEDFQE